MQRIKLTKDFYLDEFKSKDGSSTPIQVLINLTKLAIEMQVLRDHFGRSITINSGYRSESHNKKVGGVENSKHLIGIACDFTVEGVSPSQVADEIEVLIKEGKLKNGGLGRYNSFTHYDIRESISRWDFTS